MSDLQPLNTEIWQPAPVINPQVPGGELYFAWHSVLMTTGLPQPTLVTPVLLSSNNPQIKIGKNESARTFVVNMIGSEAVDKAYAFDSGLIFTGARTESIGPGTKNASVPLWIPEHLMTRTYSQRPSYMLAASTDEVKISVAPHTHQQLPSNLMNTVMSSKVVSEAIGQTVNATAVTEITLDNRNKQLPFMGAQALRLFLHSSITDELINLTAIIVPDVEQSKLGQIGLEIKGSHKVLVGLAMFNAWLGINTSLIQGYSIKTITPPNYGDTNTVAALQAQSEPDAVSRRKAFYALNIKFAKPQPNS